MPYLLTFDTNSFGEFKVERTGDDEWVISHNDITITPFRGTPNGDICDAVLRAYRSGRRSGHALGIEVGKRHT